MPKTNIARKNADIKSKTLHAAAELFLERGYTEATVRDIANLAGVNVSTMIRMMKSKENIMCELVKYVLEGQFEATKKLLADKTEDKLMLYAAETTLQIYMTESDERVRELYAVAYSLPETSTIITNIVTGKLEPIFKEYLPGLESKDFYELEIATGGIIRGFMTVPCDRYFTIDRKVRRFLEAALRVYKVPQEKIEEAIAFVSQFDFSAIAKATIDNMLSYLKNKT